MKVASDIVRKYYKYNTTPTVSTTGLTVSSGVVSGFAGSTYITMPLSSLTDITEAQVCFTTGSDVNTAQGLFLSSRSNGYSCICIHEYKIKMLVTTSGGSTTWYDLISSIQANTKYYFKFTQTGTIGSSAIITPYISTDGSTYTAGTTQNITLQFGNFIGAGINSTYPNAYFYGSVDLTKTYVKRGTVEWHGTYKEETTEAESEFYEDVTVYKVFGITVRNYYKYQYSSWTQPTLTADGTIGVDDFAVTSDPAVFATYYCWYAFNSEGTSGSGTGWAVQGNSGNYIMYSKNALCITNIMFTNRNESSTRAMTSGTIYGSNNGTTWTQLTTFTNSVTSALQTWNVSLSGNTTYYNYYKIYGANSDSYTGIGQLTLTATQRTVTAGTSTDYDFYEDTTTYNASPY